MHSTTGQTSSTVSSSSTSTPSSSSSSTTTPNIEQYHYPPISTLRRPSRPSNIDLSVFDINNTQQPNDPGIYSAPICQLNQPNNTNHHHHHHHHPHHIQQSSVLLSPHLHAATFHYQPQQQQQHIQLSSHHHQQQQQQQHNIHQYQQQAHHQQQQQQQHILDPFSQHQHTPHTFPLQTSSNHYHHYFHFPPSTQNLRTTNNSTPPAYNQLTLQTNVTNNGHHSPLNHRQNPVSSSTTNTSQPSTPTHNNRLLAVQIQEQQQQWSNPVLSPLMVKRINEGANVVTSIPLDDDDDPSASIDALVADVDSSSHDLLDEQQNKSIDENKTTSTTPLTESHASTTSPSPHLYLRSTSHILTTPPNPLASNNHLDNQLTVGNNFQKTFSPIHSAGFELTTNNSVQISSTSTTTRTSFFTFDTNVLEQNDLKTHLNDDNKEDNQDKMIKPLIINTDERINIISNNSLSQDDNSNHSSTNSSNQNTSSRTLSQILQSSGEKTRLSSSSPLSTDIKVSPLDSKNNNKSQQINMSSLSPQQQINRHYCTHPDCAKVFANKSALAKHKLTHCQDRKHKCYKCNKGFKRLDHLHGHMLTHEEEKPHKCRVPDCNRTYCDARSLKRHIENTHQNILAAIHEGGHDEYKNFLPDTAFVKTKELSSDFSIDSIDSNSPRSSSIENDQTYHMNQQIRSTNGHKIIPTYTFDEEKCVECHICKKSFKNGAALNGHMRLHGGFNDKQPSPSSTDNIQKKKRITPPINTERRQTKRKRPNSPITSNNFNQRPLLQRSIPIKNEEEDIMMISSSSSNTNNNLYQQTIYPTLPPCSDVLQHRLYDRTLSSRTRSISSSVIQPHTNPLTHYNIKNPMSVQPIPNIPKQNRKQIPLPTYLYDRNNNHHYGFDIRTNEESIHNRINNTNNSLNIPTGILRFDHLTNPQMFSNVTTIQSHDEKFRKTLSADETLKYYHRDRQINGLSPSKDPQNYPYFRSISNQHYPSNVSQLPVPSQTTSTINPNIFHQILRHTNDIFNKEFYLPRTEHSNQHHSTLDEPIRYTPSTSPYTVHLYHSPSPRIIHSPGDKIHNSTSSVINTPVTSPYSNINPSHCSPSSSNDMCNNTINNTSINSMQPSPLSNSSLSNAAFKKRILNAVKQEAQDEQQQNNQIIQDLSPIIEQNIDQDKQQQINIENSLDDQTSSLTLKIIRDNDSPIIDRTKKLTSAFLITTPSSSTTTNSSISSSSSSSNTHFNYENLPQTIPSKISDNTNNSSFQWPSQISQFRRQQSINIGSQTPNPIPSTPYTPPPMLSPFRKGPGLYYHVFSQTTPAAQQTTTVTTPILPFTPIPDEILGPKINIGEEYQAIIPKLQINMNDDDTDNDELLFSPSHLPYLDENSLEKYEQLSRTNPLLFSPRHSPTLYPIELVYMLLHEYNGDLQRTLAALLDGTAQDIKQCRPLHRYHFPECDTWTKEEIDAFTKAMETSEKNFLLVSRAVGTKNVKQCIEFHYMPKVNLTNRETGTNFLIAKRKRLQMIKNKQQGQKQIFDDETSSSSSFNELRLDDDGSTMSNDHFSCDIDDCLQTFTSERAYRAHRNDHRRIKNNITPPTNSKRSRNLDLNK